MRSGVVQRIVSRLLWFTVCALSVPFALSAVLGERVWWAWLVALMLAGVLAYSLSRLPSALAAPRDSIRRREGFLAVTMGWLVFPLFTALAYHLTGGFAGFAETFFEAMSGYTTTGASILTDIEAMPRSVLFMRSFSHWIGGMGIIVLSVAVLPELAVGGMQMFAAESTGIDSDKLAPRIGATARRLWVIYFVMTAAQTLLLLFAMGPFDAINHAMATIATGGFSTKNASIAHFDSVYVEVVVTIFMFLSGMSFALLYRAFLHGQIRRLIDSPEVRLYTIILVAAILLITLDTWVNGDHDLASALRHSAFNTVSVMTTTGFASSDFDLWPDSSRLLLVGLMVLGACAGSTAGGSKVVRLYVVVKHAIAQMRKLVRPRLVQTLQIGDRDVSRETTEAILGFYLLFFASMIALGLAMTALGLDLVSGMTASVSAMNSIGPGLGSVGAVRNFAGVQDVGLYLLAFGMMLGRLELYPVLILFTVHFWRRG